MSELALPYRRALVVGMGRSGLAAAELLLAAGVEVRAHDQNATATIPGGATPHLGGLPDAAFIGIDLLVLSPGVPPAPHVARSRALAPRARVHGELSLALSLPVALRTPTVLITGTNGKSTVTAMTGALLEAAGRKVFVGGNLGDPPAERLLAVARGEEAVPDVLVLECSSYQLETLDAHPTAVAMVLNVTPDHLDRYDSIEDYADTKGRIFAGLGPTGLALLDARDEFTPRLRTMVPDLARCVLVDGDAPPMVDEQAIVLGHSRISRNRLRVAGRHNAKNALFAALAAAHLGVDDATLVRALASFDALPHRMNLIAEHEGILYYDDSKATNVAAVLASLDGFDRPFVLIAGGQAKDDDPSPLAELLARNGRGLVALGRDADRFLRVAEGVVPTVRARSMQDAVSRASAMASAGEAVVLSPACASWDMFQSYAHRGDEFARAVACLRK